MRIVLSPYDPGWKASFQQIEELLVSALGDRAITIEHVGSTAVPNLIAKPVIDVVLVVRDSSREHEYAGDLEAAGLEFHAREPDWWEHRLFKLDTPQSNVHVFSVGCPEIERMIEFRDFLRKDAHARETYESRKRELSRREWSRVQEYADAKAEIVQRLLTSTTKSDK